jgi:hypothetical protein
MQGEAGLLCALRRLAKTDGATRAGVAAAATIGDRILGRRQRVPAHPGLWTTIRRRSVCLGAAHGSAGIALALASAYALTGRSRFRDVAAEALATLAAGWLSLAAAGRVGLAPGLKERLVERLRSGRVAEGRVEMPWAFRMGLFKGISDLCLAALLAESPAIIANPLLGWS